MKLVDILAVELKCWPELLGDAVGQAADGTLHNEMEPEDVEIDRTLESYTLCKHFISDIVTRAEWQAAVDALNQSELDAVLAKNEQLAAARAERIPVWNGEGLPPVGIECEWHPNVHGWVKVKILGRDGSDTWYRASGEEHSQTCRNMAFFRPIRTAEQVAAEEREKDIREMASIPKPCGHALYNICADLYDAGYRKQVAK